MNHNYGYQLNQTESVMNFKAMKSIEYKKKIEGAIKGQKAGLAEVFKNISLRSFRTYLNIMI